MERLEPETLREILTRAVGADRADRAVPAFFTPASVSVRRHPSKTDAAFAGHFGPGAAPVPWNPLGLLLEKRPSFTLDPLLHAGCYYVQDSSAMYVGEVFRRAAGGLDVPGSPVRVLDLCAAPGGKSTDLAASLRTAFGDGFLLVANEVMRDRTGILADNLALWGDPCTAVTSADPKAFAALEGFFDAIVADVPCSGEGMFRKDPVAVRAWSEDHVRHCAARQRRILSDVWPALRTGGILVYSTCTFEEAENDALVEWAAGQLGAEVLPVPAFPQLVPTRTGALLVPGFVPGEGQFAAVLRKTAPAAAWRAPRGKAPARAEELRYVPESIAADLASLQFLRPLRAGTPLGVRKGTDLVPDPDAALLIGEDRTGCPAVEVDAATALHFLHGDALRLPDAPKGFVRICHEGHPLGFVKNLGNRCNNLHPARRRIRMDV